MMLNLKLILTIIFVFATCLERSIAACDNGDVTKLAAWQQELMIPDRNMGAVCIET